MDPLVIPFLTYAVVTTFTPGPNNISASTVGMRQGYRRTLWYLLGMSVGFLPITFYRLLKFSAARLAFNIVMALLLAYSAVEIVLH